VLAEVLDEGHNLPLQGHNASSARPRSWVRSQAMRIDGFPTCLAFNNADRLVEGELLEPLHVATRPVN
jgi:hypothetical protein